MSNEHGDEFTDGERAAILRLADERGDQRAARLLGIQAATLARILARRTTRNGTVYLVRAKLASLASSTEARASPRCRSRSWSAS